MPDVRLPASWPEPGDARAALLLAERLGAACIVASERDRLRTPQAAAMVGCLGGNSPYLSDLAVREVAVLLAVLRDGPSAVVAEALAVLDRVDRTTTRSAIAAALRTAKRRVALAVAVADLGGMWSLEDVSAALSRLSERCLAAAVEHLLGEATRAGLLTHSSGLVVIGLGKLGAGELNYSSDVDLLLLYEPQADRDPERASSTFSRIARDLVALMQARDANGYAFRVDLRLRPHPQSTPPALPIEAALSYYEALGETWERAALSKARAVAGDLALGERFLDAVAPFVWRRHLDFAVVEDMRAMKARIDRRQTTSGPGLPGYDLKLGAGGIREIEFAAQTLQLVWGGREPDLRARGTLAALRGLEVAGRLPPDHARALGRGYRALRQVEHRLQMVADRQTHALPADPAEFERFARFMGERDGAALSARMLAMTLPVHRIFTELFAGGDGGGWDAAVASLPSLGFGQAEATLVEHWRAGGVRALRHERARALFGQLLDPLLSALRRQRNPEAALARFARLIEQLPAGVQVFSLLVRNPALVDRIADLLGASSLLADHLAAVPAALEGLLAADEALADPRRTLTRELAGMRDGGTLEVAIETTRRFTRGEAFRLSLAELGGRDDVDRTGAARTALAEAAVQVLLARVLALHEARHGRVAGGGMVVVALGKAGSREMMAGSDLDLMLVYDGPGGAESVGRSVRTLPLSAFYGRLAQALVSAVTARGLDGALYEVDMRLRPSGNQGPVAVSLEAFERYHRERAWTWERMALTRARVVAGPARLRRRTMNAIADALDRAGTGEQTRADAAAMRGRLRRDKPAEGAWDVKMRDGGLLDVEFIAQALQLDPAVPRPSRHPTTRRALEGLARAGLLGQRESARLIEADRFWRTVQSNLRLMLGNSVPHQADERLRESVATALHVPPDGIEAHMDNTASGVRESFERHIGRVEAGA